MILLPAEEGEVFPPCVCSGCRLSYKECKCKASGPVKGNQVPSRFDLFGCDVIRPARI